MMLEEVAEELGRLLAPNRQVKDLRIATGDAIARLAIMAGSHLKKPVNYENVSATVGQELVRANYAPYGWFADKFYASNWQYKDGDHQYLEKSFTRRMPAHPDFVRNQHSIIRHFRIEIELLCNTSFDHFVFDSCNRINTFELELHYGSTTWSVKYNSQQALQIVAATHRRIDQGLPAQGWTTDMYVALKQSYPTIYGQPSYILDCTENEASAMVQFIIDHFPDRATDLLSVLQYSAQYQRLFLRDRALGREVHPPVITSNSSITEWLLDRGELVQWTWRSRPTELHKMLDVAWRKNAVINQHSLWCADHIQSSKRMRGDLLRLIARLVTNEYLWVKPVALATFSYLDSEMLQCLVRRAF